MWRLTRTPRSCQIPKHARLRTHDTSENPTSWEASRMLHSHARSRLPRRPDLAPFSPPDTRRCRRSLSWSRYFRIPLLLRQFAPELRAGRREFRYPTELSRIWRGEDGSAGEFVRRRMISTSKVTSYWKFMNRRDFLDFFLCCSFGWENNKICAVKYRIVVNWV